MHILKGWSAVCQFYRRYADRPDVRATSVSAIGATGLTGHHFRRHPIRRAYTTISLTKLALYHPRKTEIHQSDFALLRQKYVAAADVSVNDVVFV